MQGIVMDEERNYVKAAIVKMFKMQDLSDDSDTEAEVVTYAMTDENGRFVIRDLDPDENYTIEIHVEEATGKITEVVSETESTDIKGAEGDTIKADNLGGTDNFNETDNIDNEEEDFIDTDNVDEYEDFIQTDSTDVSIDFIQKEELTGISFTSDLRPETELKEKLYTIKNYTW